MPQTGPADPQVIAGASTAKINVGQKKLAGHAIATVRVGEDGQVREVLITENTTEPGFEPQLVKVLQSARFRPGIDESGRPVEASIEMKVELRSSTGNEPKPVAAKADPQLNDREKARIRKMRCSDFIWEWDLIREEAGDATAMEFMPRIATMMYVTMRSDAGDYVDSKVWKAAPKSLRETVDQCRESPGAPFWDGIFKSVMDEAVPR
jgi:Gram-negative bacterial TonB protein C-terminal